MPNVQMPLHMGVPSLSDLIKQRQANLNKNSVFIVSNNLNIFRDRFFCYRFIKSTIFTSTASTMESTPTKGPFCDDSPLSTTTWSFPALTRFTNLSRYSGKTSKLWKRKNPLTLADFGSN